MIDQARALRPYALRPGPVVGPYPERDDREAAWPDPLAHALRASVSRLLPRRSETLTRVAERIDRLGATLETATDQRLHTLVAELRCRLHSQGLTEALCLRAFALIREMAARTLGQRPYAQQLMAGWVMLHGQLAEMATGEGKTLAVTLPAATAALAGIPVHVLTVNEYLVQRDATTMGPLFRALGLSVGSVTQTMAPLERQAAYACDLTYATNQQVAFDYLRDRLERVRERSPLRRQLTAAAASAATAGSRPSLLLRGLCFALVDEADSILIDEARTPLILSQAVDASREEAIYRQALDLARTLVAGEDFQVDPGHHRIRLTLAGQHRLQRTTLPGAALWQNARHREQLVGQALHALHLLRRDREYLVRDTTLVLIDVHTGRTMPERSWERGLHQMVEAKEGCPLTPPRETVARLTYQRFFRRYLRLGGMTGTAREVRDELWSIYGLRVRQIPLRRPSQRRHLPDRVFARTEEKWAAVLAQVQRCHAQGQPILIGTGSVAESEQLSSRLTAAAIPHRVLNARQDRAEAEIVAQAGRQGQVTVATNMAGRGTDIPLAAGVAPLGGLHVLATCQNEARRIDRQLFGRCARQGEPGSCQALLSLDDELVQRQVPPWLRRLALWWLIGLGPGGQGLGRWLLRHGQRTLEAQHRRARHALLRQERHTAELLAFSGEPH